MSRIATEELRRIAEVATPGPWSASHNGHYWQIDTERDGQIGDACASKFIHQNGSVGSIITEAQASFIAQENARLIALAPALAAEVLQLREANERLREGLERIEQWSLAYPVSVFPEPDMKAVAAVFANAGMSLDAVSASNMRHVVQGVGDIARAALSTPSAHVVDAVKRETGA